MDVLHVLVAVVALEKLVTVDSTETFVNICATTNSTLERSLNLTLITEITGNNGAVLGYVYIVFLGTICTCTKLWNVLYSYTSNCGSSTYY